MSAKPIKLISTVHFVLYNIGILLFSIEKSIFSADNLVFFIIPFSPFFIFWVLSVSFWIDYKFSLKINLATLILQVFLFFFTGCVNGFCAFAQIFTIGLVAVGTLISLIGFLVNKFKK